MGFAEAVAGASAHAATTARAAAEAEERIANFAAEPIIRGTLDPCGTRGERARRNGAADTDADRS
jgi:hypothetical protein